MGRTLVGLLTGAIVAGLCPGLAITGGRAMTVDDLLAVRSVSDPQLSPDGKRVVYVVSEVDRDADKSNSSLWMVSVAGDAPMRRLTSTPGVNTQPRWSPDGSTIAFVSSRGGPSQVWLLPVDGGEARRLTHLPIDVSGPVWSPRGDWIAFTAEVYPRTTPEQTADRDKKKAAGPTKVRVFDHLMVRHWSAWDEGKRSHLFAASVESGATIDLTVNFEVNVPPAPFGGPEEYAWAPDGKVLVFTVEPRKDAAWSTNTDLLEVSVPGGRVRNLTESNPAADSHPLFSPDGRWIAFLRQTRPGFESDLSVLSLLRRDTGAVVELTRPLDRPVSSFVWRGDRGLVAVVDDRGTMGVRSIEFGLDGDRVTAPSKFPTLLSGGVSTSVQSAGKDGPLVYVHHSADRPAEVYATQGQGEPRRLTRHNDTIVGGLDLAKAESFTFAGADGDEVSGWLVRPPGFDPEKKYPVVFLIHGGPQGAWHDEWHGRWNYGMFASPGFALVAINPRGSTGYGQTFTDQISRDWTGRVYVDLMKGLDHALKTYPFLDADRMAAAGGSYGGFMVNWMLGHTDRFKAMVSHAGVFDLPSKYGTTEELWFPEWEFGGTPWEKPEEYLERSPSRFVEKFQTPTLVIHGALDFRVSDGQGLGLFTALQRRGVPSRLVYFPDEGHWILKPGNRVAWWNEVNGWMSRYLKK